MTRNRIAGATATALACLLACQGALAADADLAVTISVLPASPVAGEQATYTIGVENLGPDDAAGVSVTVGLDADMTYASHGGAGSYDSGTGIWTVGTVVNGASEQLTLVADVPSSVAALTPLDTTATVSSGSNDPNAVNDTDIDSAVSATSADLAVTISVLPASPVAGEQATYTIDVDNLGPSDAVNVTVAMTLADGLSFASGDPGPTYVWPAFDLSIAVLTQLTVVVDVSSGVAALTLLDTTAAVSSDTLDPNAANDVHTDSAVSATSADLSMGIVGPATVVAGSQYFYVFTVTNIGPSDATGVVVTVTLPAGLSYLSDSTVFGTYDGSTGEWTIGGLGAGVPATLRLVVDVDNLAVGPGSIGAGVTASGDPDPDGGNDSDTLALTIDPAPPAGGVDCTPGAGNPLSAALAAMLVALALTRRRAQAGTSTPT